MPTREDLVRTLIGGAAALIVAICLIPARDWLDNTNVALALVVVVVASAVLGGRLVGTATALVAALAFNFLHTEPYGTFRIARHEDFVTTVLLAVVGLVIGSWPSASNAAGDALGSGTTPSSGSTGSPSWS